MEISKGDYVTVLDYSTNKIVTIQASEDYEDIHDFYDAVNEQSEEVYLKESQCSYMVYGGKPTLVTAETLLTVHPFE